LRKGASGYVLGYASFTSFLLMLVANALITIIVEEYQEKNTKSAAQEIECLVKIYSNFALNK